MTNKTKKIVKISGIIFVSVIGGLLIGYDIGRTKGYDEGVFAVLNEALKDNSNLKIYK